MRLFLCLMRSSFVVSDDHISLESGEEDEVSLQRSEHDDEKPLRVPKMKGATLLSHNF